MKKTLRILTVALVAVLCLAALGACLPSDSAKAVENLKAAGYTVTEYSSDSLFGLGGLAMPENCSRCVYAYKGNEDDASDMVSLFYFSSSDAAKTYYDKLKEEQEADEKEMKTNYDEGEITESEYNEYKEEMKKYKISKSGEVVAAGTTQGVKDCQ